VTKTDAELVALLSLEHPEKPHNVLAKLRGTYSFVVVDTVNVRIFASRDPTGIAPLFLVRCLPLHHRHNPSRTYHQRPGYLPSSHLSTRLPRARPIPAGSLKA
jgi:hypothetical protein